LSTGIPLSLSLCRAVLSREIGRTAITRFVVVAIHAQTGKIINNSASYFDGYVEVLITGSERRTRSSTRCHIFSNWSSFSVASSATGESKAATVAGASLGRASEGAEADHGPAGFSAAGEAEILPLPALVKITDKNAEIEKRQREKYVFFLVWALGEEDEERWCLSWLSLLPCACPRDLWSAFFFPAEAGEEDLRECEQPAPRHRNEHCWYLAVRTVRTGGASVTDCGSSSSLALSLFFDCKLADAGVGVGGGEGMGEGTGEGLRENGEAGR
jgi:hypothetical protein